MTTLIRLSTPTELATYEGCSLAMTLATFEHSVQLMLDNETCGLLFDDSARIGGMLKSLSLYDMPKAWLPADAFSGWLTGRLDEELASQLELMPKPATATEFSTILTF